jgi:hypothetical protein
MTLQALAESLIPLAATQPRDRLHSPFSPLVGWLATLWLSEERNRANKNLFFVPDPDLFIFPANDPPPTVRSIGSPCIAPCGNDDDDDNNNNEVSEKRIPLVQPQKDGLTKEEFDYVVNSLLEYLEEAKLAPPESGYEECRHYVHENTERMLRNNPWYAPLLRTSMVV